MSKAVLLSIHHEWAEKIYSGEKEVEWRKTFPTHYSDVRSAAGAIKRYAKQGIIKPFWNERKT